MKKSTDSAKRDEANAKRRAAAAEKRKAEQAERERAYEEMYSAEFGSSYDRSRRDIHVLKKYGLVRLDVKYGEKTLIYKT